MVTTGLHGPDFTPTYLQHWHMLALSTIRDHYLNPDWIISVLDEQFAIKQAMGRFFFYMQLLSLETLHPFLNRLLHKHKRTIYSTFCYLYLSALCLVKYPNPGKISLLLIAFALYLQAITCWSVIFLTDRSNRAVQKTRETTVPIVLCFFV